MKRQTNACQVSEFRGGDEVLFKFEGLLVGRVERVQFDGGKVRYELTLAAECEVPESLIVGRFDGKGGEGK